VRAGHRWSARSRRHRRPVQVTECLLVGALAFLAPPGQARIGLLPEVPQLAQADRALPPAFGRVPLLAPVRAPVPREPRRTSVRPQRPLLQGRSSANRYARVTVTGHPVSLPFGAGAETGQGRRARSQQRTGISPHPSAGRPPPGPSPPGKARLRRRRACSLLPRRTRPTPRVRARPAAAAPTHCVGAGGGTRWTALREPRPQPQPHAARPDGRPHSAPRARSHPRRQPARFARIQVAL
jgi:hypothetical protein